MQMPSDKQAGSADPPTHRRPRTGKRPARQNQTGADSNDGRWSRRVTQTSNALDLDAGIFSNGTAREIARSLKRSALRSRRRKGTPFQSAMSMLNFYINRAGTNLPESRRQVLEEAKRELRDAFGRTRPARK
jgi:hypothetical protein